MHKKESEDNQEGVTINSKISGIAEFVKRPVPSDKQVEEFEEYLDENSSDLTQQNDRKGAVGTDEVSTKEEYDQGFDGAMNDVTDEEIEESLEEIYQDDKGRMVDVRRMQVLRKRGVLFWFFTFLISLGALSAFAYFGYEYFLHAGTDATQVEFYIDTESEVMAGQEYFYGIKYRNDSKINLRVPRIELVIPDNFVVTEAIPESKNGENRIWDFDAIGPQDEGEIKIKGMMIGPKDATGVLQANLLYTPDNFSSEFRKEATVTTLIKDTGLDVSVNYIKTALVGETNEVDFTVNAKEKNFINNFRLTIEQQDNMTVSLVKPEKNEAATGSSTIEESRPGVYMINSVTEEEENIPIKIVFQEKKNNIEKVPLRMEKIDPQGEYRTFWSDELSFEVLKSDLNVALIVNGSRENQGINFGDKLNYTIAYNNKGETAMNDVVIMVVVDSEFLDWTTLDTPVSGREKGNTITWTKEEIPELKTLDRHEEGTIDFSVNVMDVTKVEPGKKYEIKSYAQYSVGELENGETPEKDEDNQSNAITNEINSDLRLVEQLRYFNDDNITVGNGPLPLQVGQKTSFKVYWAVTNNLHELTDAKVEVSLPDYVEWDEKNRTNVGEVRYDSQNRRVIWDIGRLPLSVFRADAEFNISVTPTEDDKNKIMVLKPGSKVTATDSETGDKIEKITEAKTSKLEDDELSQKTNDGVVR